MPAVNASPRTLVRRFAAPASLRSAPAAPAALDPGGDVAPPPLRECGVHGAWLPGGLLSVLPSSGLPATASILDRVQQNAAHDRRPWEPSCVEVTGGGELIFYFETHRREGLAGYRRLAEAVVAGRLAGRVENRMDQGFATWTVSREQYLALADAPALASPATSAADDLGAAGAG